MLKALELEATLTFLSSVLHQNTNSWGGGGGVFQLLYAQLYVAYCELCGGKLLKGKSKTHNMSEKRLKINKFASYHSKIVGNNSAFDRHDDFDPSQKTVYLWYMT